MSRLFTSGGQSIGASTSAWSELQLHHVGASSSTSSIGRNSGPSNEYSRLLPLGLTGWISLQSKRLSRVLSYTTVHKHQFFSTQASYGPTLTSIHDYWKNHSFDYMNLCGKVMSLLFNTLSMFVIAFLLRRKCLLISWLLSLSSMILEPKKIKSATVSIPPPPIYLA